jgi:hypothetical protein
MTLADNSKTTVKPRGRPFRKGQSGNPKGAPKRGESWAEIIKRIGDMTPVEAADHARAIANKLRVMGDAITLKEAVVVRVYASLLFEPTSSLLNTFMERAEGKVTEPIDLTSKGEKLGTNDDYRAIILRKLSENADTGTAGSDTVRVNAGTSGETNL